MIGEVKVLGSRIDLLSWDGAVERMSGWAEARQSRVVCICNVHSVVTAGQDPAFKAVLDGADLVTADGAPVAWMSTVLSGRRQSRINGPDLMWRYLQHAADHGQAMFFYGSTTQCLRALVDRVQSEFPQLTIAGSYSPPFRTLTEEESGAVVEQINRSGASVVWVGLGCPKQEQWMAAQKGRIEAVMVGVGAAFDYHSGALRRAPRWMQRSGLEWLYRLGSEPKRLWRRYTVTNSVFLVNAGRQLLVAAWLAAFGSRSSPRRS